MSTTAFFKHTSDFINKFLNIFGFAANFFYYSKNPNYEIINSEFPVYAPWNKDKDFKELFKMIQSNTYIGKYRLYELWQLVGEVKKIPGALIEVGVWRGGSGAIISKKAELCGIKDTIYLCDTFKGVVKADYDKDTLYKGGEHGDTSKKLVTDLIENKLKIKNVKILEGIFPNETKHLIKEHRFRFCHIDVDVYNSARDIVNWIWPKMPIGGIIVYDDYGHEECSGITRFVEEERKKTDRIIFYNLNGHAVVIKIG